MELTVEAKVVTRVTYVAEEFRAFETTLSFSFSSLLRSLYKSVIPNSILIVSLCLYSILIAQKTKIYKLMLTIQTL